MNAGRGVGFPTLYKIFCCGIRAGGRWDGMRYAFRALITVAASFVAVPGTARTTLGSFENWGAFRDEAPTRCFAIAQPVRGGGGGKWSPFASVGSWPQSGVRGQFYVRLSRERRADSAVTLIIDDRKFALVAGAADAWAPDARTDAAIVAAMRSARSMSVASVAATGGGFAETYVLKGAATAIDAAALGCARR